MFRFILTAALVVAIQIPGYGYGGGLLFRRNNCSSGYCQPSYSHSYGYQAAIVEPYVATAAPIIIQNNYPPAISSTVYGYDPQGLASPYRVDPAEYLRGAERMVKASQELALQGIGAYSTAGEEALRYQAQADLVLAQAELLKASQLQAAPQRQVAQQQAHSATQRIVLTQQADGTWKADIQSSVGQDGGGDGDSPSKDAGDAVLRDRCAKCHTGTSAKAGFVLFDDSGNYAKLSQIKIDQINHLIKTGAMPPVEAGRELNDFERAAVQVFLNGG